LIRLSLGTHVLLWALAELNRLHAKVQAMIEGPENEMFFSFASTSTAF